MEKNNQNDWLPNFFKSFFLNSFFHSIFKLTSRFAAEGALSSLVENLFAITAWHSSSKIFSETLFWQTENAPSDFLCFQKAHKDKLCINIYIFSLSSFKHTDTALWGECVILYFCCTKAVSHFISASLSLSHPSLLLISVCSHLHPLLLLLPSLSALHKGPLSSHHAHHYILWLNVRISWTLALVSFLPSLSCHLCSFLSAVVPPFFLFFAFFSPFFPLVLLIAQKCVCIEADKTMKMPVKAVLFI